MKKKTETNKKSAVITAPTTSGAKRAATTTVKAPSAKSTVKATSKPEVPIPADAGASAHKKLPLPAANVTTITATVDVGWGNQLHVRGEGGGLSWDKGVPLECKGNKTWVWVSTSNDPVFTFKFLLNDLFWARGDNLVVPRNGTHTSSPQF
jgi:hypothetical protein